MKTAYVVYKGEISDYHKTGKNFYRYTYQLYNRMKKNSYGIEVEPIECGGPNALGKGGAVFLNTFTRDLTQFDIVHSPDFVPMFPLRKGNAKIVTTAHDFQFALEPEINPFSNNLSDIKGMLFQKVILPASLKTTLASDYLISVSTMTRDDAVKLGYERKRIFVVNHGVDERFINKPIRKRSKGFVVGTMSIGGPRKNLPFSIRAIKMLGKDVRFEMWGNLTFDDPEFEYAKASSNMKFMGFAPDDKIVDIYDNFDVFLFPSLYEGFGIPLIEAQARGLPVVIYKKGKIPEETRRYCLEAKDEEHMADIIRKIKENGYNEKDRKKAMAYARSFTWDKTADETLKAYMKMK